MSVGDSPVLVVVVAGGMPAAAGPLGVAHFGSAGGPDDYSPPGTVPQVALVVGKQVDPYDHTIFRVDPPNHAPYYKSQGEGRRGDFAFENAPSRKNETPEGSPVPQPGRKGHNPSGVPAQKV